MGRLCLGSNAPYVHICMYVHTVSFTGEVDKLKRELLKEKAKAMMKLDLEEEHDGLKRSNQVINVVHGLVEIANKSLHRQMLLIIALAAGGGNYFTLLNCMKSYSTISTV